MAGNLSRFRIVTGSLNHPDLGPLEKGAHYYGAWINDGQVELHVGDKAAPVHAQHVTEAPYPKASGFNADFAPERVPHEDVQGASDLPERVNLGRAEGYPPLGGIEKLRRMLDEQDAVLGRGVASNVDSFVELFAGVTEADLEEITEDEPCRALEGLDPLPSNGQVGGNHYSKYEIQPTYFLHQNGIGFLEGNVIKYAIRHRDKNGAQDLLKAKHYIDLLLEWEYGCDPSGEPFKD